ncbi:DNA-directed RNA polymerase subunit beta [Candidatus Parcubacteria bacterium]|nr:DNA-directed RNA polymerase subunit beta [Candidatus Parcubacteria bacterium]
MKIKYFGKSKVYLPLPYLLEIQQQRWKEFWDKDLKELLSEVSPIKDYTGKELEFWFLDYKLGAPKYKNDLEAKQNNDSYEAPLRVKVRLVNLKTKEENEQEVFLTDFPLMTERGTFIINGVERVVISQLIRSPGSFFTEKKGHFGAKIIPNRGAWLEFETESTGLIVVKIDRKRKAPVSTLLRAFGLSENKQIEEMFQDVDTGEVKYIKETLARDSSHNQVEAIQEVYQRLRPGDLASPDAAKELIENMFFNFQRYDLSKVGVWKMRQRLPGIKSKKQDITTKDRILHLEYVVETVKEIIRLNNNPKAKPDEIDHLGNRRVRTINELLQNRLRVGLMRVERNIKDRMSTLDIELMSPNQLVNPRPFIAVLKEFFAASQMSQFMDNENPLSELEHKRRLSATGPGGLTRERAGFEVRDVQPSHYGRICPIQTSEGGNIGLIGHLAGFAVVNPYGFIETPYFKVEKAKITSKVHYLNAYEEERYNIAHAGIEIDDKGQIKPIKVEARIKGEPGTIEREKIDFIDVSPQQSISVAASLIPFLQNDDATRALMGSNMQKQAVPVINPEVPLVGTGVEKKVVEDCGQVAVVKEDGVVTDADAERITIKSFAKQKSTTYNLNTFTRTNQYTCLHEKPRVKKGQKIKKGEVISDGGAIKDGRLALGRNVLVAFLPWRGGNYEDAVIISERLVKEDYFTSIHAENFFCDVRETKLGPEITTPDISNVSVEKLKDLDEDGIIRVGAEVKPNDILVGKISPKGESGLTAEERLLLAIFGEKAKEVKDTSLRMQHGKRGRVVGVKIFSREMGHHLEPGIIKRIRIEIAELRPIQAGDKLSGRHGNKGVISKVLPECEMPFTEDGTPIDMLLNPLGVASRMNLGQILEMHLGLCAKKLGYLAVTPSLAGAVEQDIREELKKAGFSEDGKVKLFDGKTGLAFPEKVAIGYPYIMKLVHMVEDKVFARSIGPYSLITQQPLGGKAQFGGQRLGEMEVWALEGYGAAHVLQEMLTIKSDDVPGRADTYESILKGEEIRNPNIPASFKLLVSELKSLGMSVEVKEKSKSANNEQKTTDDKKEQKQSIARQRSPQGTDPQNPQRGFGV